MCIEIQPSTSAADALLANNCHATFRLDLCPNFVYDSKSHNEDLLSENADCTFNNKAGDPKNFHDSHGFYAKVAYAIEALQADDCYLNHFQKTICNSLSQVCKRKCPSLASVVDQGHALDSDECDDMDNMRAAIRRDLTWLQTLASVVATEKGIHPDRVYADSSFSDAYTHYLLASTAVPNSP